MVQVNQVCLWIWHRKHFFALFVPKSVLFFLSFFFSSTHSVAFNTFLRSQGADMEPMESTSSIALQSNQIQNYDNSSISSSSNQQKFIESQQQQQQQQLVDDNSTDSSSFDDDSARKKHRRKLHFPFGKKTFQKNKHIWFGPIVIDNHRQKYYCTNIKCKYQQHQQK